MIEDTVNDAFNYAIIVIPPYTTCMNKLIILQGGSIKLTLFH